MTDEDAEPLTPAEERVRVLLHPFSEERRRTATSGRAGSRTPRAGSGRCGAPSWRSGRPGRRSAAGWARSSAGGAADDRRDDPRPRGRLVGGYLPRLGGALLLLLVGLGIAAA